MKKPTASVMGRPVMLHGPLGDLARALGGTAALAARLGVSSRALQRWARDGLPIPIALLVERLATELGAPRIAALVRKERRAKSPPPRATSRLKATGIEPGSRVRMTGPFGELARKVGGTTRLAELLGASRRSIQKWAQGVCPPRLAWGLLTRLAAENDLSPEARREFAEMASRRPGHAPSRPSSSPDHAGTLRTPSRRVQHRPKTR